MEAQTRRRTALVVVGATSLAVVGVLIWVALGEGVHPHIEPLFSEDAEIPSWPPESPVSVEVELGVSDGARTIGSSSGSVDAGGSIDAGLRHRDDMPGLHVRTGHAQGLEYIEAVLGVDAEFDDPMPLAVLIHGRGDRARIPGGPFWGLGAPIRVIVPQAPDPLGRGYEWLPVRVGENLVDRLTTSLLARAAQVATMLRDLMERLPTVGRAMVVGFSQGGLLTFALATHHSDVVQAAFPLSAWLPPALVPPYRRDDIRYPTIRGTHGSADPIIALEPTVALYDELDRRGFDVRLEVFDGVGHVMTAAMNEQLHLWLQEEMGLVVAQGIRDGVLDGGPAPCLPRGAWPPSSTPEAGWPEAGPPEAGWLDSQRPEAGWPEGGWSSALRPEAGWPDAEVPAWSPCPEPASASDAGGSASLGPPDGGLEAGADGAP